MWDFFINFCALKKSNKATGKEWGWLDSREPGDTGVVGLSWAVWDLFPLLQDRTWYFLFYLYLSISTSIFIPNFKARKKFFVRFVRSVFVRRFQSRSTHEFISVPNYVAWKSEQVPKSKPGMMLGVDWGIWRGTFLRWLKSGRESCSTEQIKQDNGLIAFLIPGTGAPHCRDKMRPQTEIRSKHTGNILMADTSWAENRQRFCDAL
jgi:hypothetical protein